MANSSLPMSTTLLFLATPMSSAKSRSASAVTPRRRIPAMVGMRGSSHPETSFSFTSWSSFRFESTV